MIYILLDKVKKFFKQLLCKHKNAKITGAILEPVYGPPKHPWERSSILYWKYVRGPWDKDVGPLKENICNDCGHQWFTMML